MNPSRAHWGIKNSLHWVLDIAFDDDRNRVRTGRANQNPAAIRHLVLNLLKQETSAKIGIKAKRKRAAWNQAYLLKNIFHLNAIGLAGRTIAGLRVGLIANWNRKAGTLRVAPVECQLAAG